MNSEDILVMIAVIAVIVSVVSVGVTYNSVTVFNSWLTGRVLETGNINLTVTTLAAINFSTSNISFGAGQITLGENYATLVSSNGTVVNGNWSAPGNGFVIENVGNLNVTMNLKAGKSAASFIGGSTGAGPVYQWNISNLKPNSCLAPANYTLDVFNDTSIAETRICDDFNFQDAADTIRIDVLIGIPDDSNTGALTDTFTVVVEAA